MSLPPDVEAKYIGIIDSILAISDLKTISAKRIRKGLQAAVDYDINSQKDAINQLIVTRFDRFEAQNDHVANTEIPATNGVSPASHATPSENHDKATSVSPSASPQVKHDTNESEDLSDIVDETPRPKKKVKRTSPEDDDAAFAAKLQAEENSRARPTRGGVVRKRSALPKTTPKKGKKSKSTVRSTDDSDVDSENEKPVKRTGAFHKPFNLSPALADLTGETTLSRPQTVKKIWDYVKERDLQDPSDKRQIRCDNALRAVFKQDSVHMFTMNKILSKNLYPIDE